MKNFAYGALAVGALWWLWKQAQPASAPVDPLAQAFQTPSSATTTTSGAPVPTNGNALVPATLNIVPSSPGNAGDNLISAINSASRAYTALEPSAPGAVNLFASGGTLGAGTVGPAPTPPMPSLSVIGSVQRVAARFGR